jgi:hypothetical protein
MAEDPKVTGHPQDNAAIIDLSHRTPFAKG